METEQLYELRDAIANHIAQAEIDQGVLLRDDYEKIPAFRTCFTFAANRILHMMQSKGLV